MFWPSPLVLIILKNVPYVKLKTTQENKKKIINGQIAVLASIWRLIQLFYPIVTIVLHLLFLY